MGNWETHSDHLSHLWTLLIVGSTTLDAGLMSRLDIGRARSGCACRADVVRGVMPSHIGHRASRGQAQVRIDLAVPRETTDHFALRNGRGQFWVSWSDVHPSSLDLVVVSRESGGGTGQYGVASQSPLRAYESVVRRLSVPCLCSRSSNHQVAFHVKRSSCLAKTSGRGHVAWLPGRLPGLCPNR